MIALASVDADRRDGQLSVLVSNLVSPLSCCDDCFWITQRNSLDQFT